MMEKDMWCAQRPKDRSIIIKETETEELSPSNSLGLAGSTRKSTNVTTFLRFLLYELPHGLLKIFTKDYQVSLTS